VRGLTPDTAVRPLGCVSAVRWRDRAWRAAPCLRDHALVVVAVVGDDRIGAEVPLADLFEAGTLPVNYDSHCCETSVSR
jgi:hypothetical protein